MNVTLTLKYFKLLKVHYFINITWTLSFQYFNFETDFLERENIFQKTGTPLF